MNEADRPLDDSPGDPTGAGERTPTVLDTLAAADGVEDAYSRLFERHFARILRSTAIRLRLPLGSCDADVEDAVQDAFVDTFERIRHGEVPGIHSPGGFRRYVSRVAVHRVIDQRRRRAAQLRGGGRVRRMSSVLGDPSASLLGAIAVDDGPDVIQRLAGQDLESRIENAILELDEPYRTAIELSVVCGMTPMEIAETGELRSRSDQKPLRKSAQVRVVLHRARETLRRRLGIDADG